MSAPPVQVTPVRSRAELKSFVRLPWRLYADAPLWVPPLVADRMQFLDRAKNPWFEHGIAEYFLARRGARVVGRITAQVDFRLQEFQGNKWGMFGFFECEDDPEAASALVDAAEAWVRARGCEQLLGPMSFSTNDEIGVLVKGFDRPPVVLSDWTHPHYPALLESTGLTKAMDVNFWELEVSEREKVHPAIWDVARASETEHGVKVRHFNKKDLKAEVGRFMEVYNAAWERNWGFVPLTDHEVEHYAKVMRPILSEDWAWVAERDGEVIGAALSIPDYNQVLKHLNGRLLPFGWAKALWHRRKIDSVRVFALGVKRGHQRTGVAAKFYEEHFESAARTPQHRGETGWILETNEPMNRAMEGMGGEVIRTYRIFERDLRAADAPAA